MTAPDDPFVRFLEAAERLPPVAVVSYRGCPAGTEPPSGVLITRGVTATSLDPAVAREGLAHDVVFAILGRTGRVLAALSSHPEEREVVLLPGTALRPAAAVTLEDSGTVVQVLEELAVPGVDGGDPVGLPRTFEELVELIREQVRAAAGSSVVGPTGKFAGPLV